MSAFRAEAECEFGLRMILDIGLQQISIPDFSNP